MATSANTNTPEGFFPCLASSAIMDLLNVTTMWVQARPLVEQAVTTLLNEPLHLIVEACLVIFVFVLIFKSSYVIPKGAVSPLSEAEKDMLIKEWEPAPLIDEKQKAATVEANLGNEDGAPMLVIHSSTGAYVSLSEDETEPSHLNMTSTGYLALHDDQEVLKKAEKALRVNGVGSCGPRGFYGTLDVHLDLEKKMAEFFGTEQAVLYSSGFATISSVIPAFSKNNDYLFVDKGISFATQTGVTLARSKTFWFDHNNVDELRKLCEAHAKVFSERVHRVFVIIEGLYFNHSDICPLDKILELKKQYPFRIILEESHSVGVLGKTGKGVTEHFGVPISSVEIIAGSTGHAIGGVGGFSVGPKEATSHQRLSASGYVFSCSTPPYIAAASIAAFDKLAKGDKVTSLQTRVKDFSKALKANIKSLQVVHGDLCPVAHLRLTPEAQEAIAASTGLIPASVANNKAFVPTARYKEDQLLQRIVDELRTQKKVIVTRSNYVFSERNLPAPSLRLTISVDHTAADMTKACKAIEEVTKSVLAELMSSSSSSSPSSKKTPKSPRASGKKASAPVVAETNSMEDDSEEQIEPVVAKKKGGKKASAAAAKKESPAASSSSEEDVEEVVRAPSPASPKGRNKLASPSASRKAAAGGKAKKTSK